MAAAGSGDLREKEATLEQRGERACTASSRHGEQAYAADCAEASPQRGEVRVFLVVAAPECSRCIGKLMRILRRSPSLPLWARHPRSATRARREEG